MGDQGGIAVGIDVGLSGALAVVRGEGGGVLVTDLAPMPLLPKGGNGPYPRIAGGTLLTWLYERAGGRGPLTIGIEQMMPFSPGKLAAFGVGWQAGYVYGLVNALRILRLEHTSSYSVRIVHVPPIRWKKKFGLWGKPKTKQDILDTELAALCQPHPWFETGKKEDRIACCEAVAIAITAISDVAAG